METIETAELLILTLLYLIALLYKFRLSEQSEFVVIHFLCGSSPLWAINLALIILGDIRNRIHNTEQNLWVAIRLLSGQRTLDTDYKC